LIGGETEELQACSDSRVTPAIWEPGLLSLVSPPQMHLQSQGPTGSICQCPLHNTRFYGKNWTLQYKQRKFQS